MMLPPYRRIEHDREASVAFPPAGVAPELDTSLQRAMHALADADGPMSPLWRRRPAGHHRSSSSAAVIRQSTDVTPALLAADALEDGHNSCSRHTLAEPADWIQRRKGQRSWSVVGVHSPRRPTARATLRATLAAGHAAHYRLEGAEDAAGLTAQQAQTLASWRAERTASAARSRGLLGSYFAHGQIDRPTDRRRGQFRPADTRKRGVASRRVRR